MIDYLEWKRSTTKNPDTAVTYERWIKRFHKFTDKISDFTLDDVMRFRTYLTEYGYSPKNIQFGLQLVRDYLHYQMTVHKMDFPLSLLKIPQERSKSHYPITHAEYAQMVSSLSLNEPQSLQRRLMITMLYETGMRVGELLRLKISDLRPKGAEIRNEKNHRNRMIGWSQNTENMLKFYLPLRNQLESEDGSLFVSFTWRPCKVLSSRQLQRIMIEVSKKCGLTNKISPHSFRHGFVHRQLQKQTPITTIAQMLGHSTTFNVMAYAQLSSNEIKEAWKM